MAGTLKLTDEDVKGIRYAKETSNLSLRAIGNLYGISATHVLRILRGEQRNRKSTKKLRHNHPIDEKRAMEFLRRAGLI